MASLADKLKQQAIEQSEALKHRDVALDSAAQGLLKSVQGVQAVTKDTKQAVIRTRRSIFFSFFVLLGVSAVFLGVFTTSCLMSPSPDNSLHEFLSTLKVSIVRGAEAVWRN